MKGFRARLGWYQVDDFRDASFKEFGCGVDTDNAMVEWGRVLEKLILFSMKGFIRSRDGGPWTSSE